MNKRKIGVSIGRFSWKAVKTSLSVGGWLLSLCLTLYLGFWYDSSGNLEIDIVSDTSVLEVREDVGDLDVLYQGRSLNASNQNLRVLELWFENTGRQPITQAGLDPNALPGVSIRDGIVADYPQVLNWTSEYIRSSIGLVLQDSVTLRLEFRILNPGDGFLVRIGILHKKSTPPSFEPVGKIAGGGIMLNVRAEDESAPTFIQRTFSGSVVTQFARLLAYSLVLIGLLMLIAFAYDKWDNYKRMRNKIDHPFDGWIPKEDLETFAYRFFGTHGSNGMAAAFSKAFRLSHHSIVDHYLWFIDHHNMNEAEELSLSYAELLNTNGLRTPFLLARFEDLGCLSDFEVTTGASNEKLRLSGVRMDPVSAGQLLAMLGDPESYIRCRVAVDRVQLLVSALSALLNEVFQRNTKERDDDLPRKDESPPAPSVPA